MSKKKPVCILAQNEDLKDYDELIDKAKKEFDVRQEELSKKESSIWKDTIGRVWKDLEEMAKVKGLLERDTDYSKRLSIQDGVLYVEEDMDKFGDFFRSLIK